MHQVSSQLVLTIERLDAIDIILGQNEIVRVTVCVHRIHESTRIIRVRQAQGVAKLMGSHYEENIAYSRKIQKDSYSSEISYTLVSKMMNINDKPTGI